MVENLDFRRHVSSCGNIEPGANISEEVSSNSDNRLGCDIHVNSRMGLVLQIKNIRIKTAGVKREVG